MQAARRCIVLDTIEKVVASGAVDRVVLVSDDRRLLGDVEVLAGTGGGGKPGAQAVPVVVVDSRELPLPPPIPADGEPGPSDALHPPLVPFPPFSSFHFGHALLQVVNELGLSRVVVMGGAAAPLITPADLEAIARRLREADAGVWANNIYSADVIAFTPAQSLQRIHLPDSDNQLPWRLHEQAGLPLKRLPRTLGLTFDVDTPADLWILGLHPQGGPRVKAFLQGDRRLQRLRQARAVLLDRRSEAFIAGRVSGRQHRFLDERTRCRLRVFSEQRGMKALGLEARGEVTSLLGFWLEQAGPEAFFESLAQCCSAAFIDSRPLLAHRGRRVPADQRIASDLGEWERVEDPLVRRFTRAAWEAPFPAILGGHSLVTGGLWALLDGAED